MFDDTLDKVQVEDNFVNLKLLKPDGHKLHTIPDDLADSAYVVKEDIDGEAEDNRTERPSNKKREKQIIISQSTPSLTSSSKDSKRPQTSS